MIHRPQCKMQTIKLLEDDTEESLNDLGFGGDFWDTIPKARSMKEELIRWT